MLGWSAIAIIVAGHSSSACHSLCSGPMPFGLVGPRTGFSVPLPYSTSTWRLAAGHRHSEVFSSAITSCSSIRSVGIDPDWYLYSTAASWSAAPGPPVDYPNLTVFLRTTIFAGSAYSPFPKGHPQSRHQE